MSIPVFSGSYRAEEVRILLTPLALEMVDVIEKERLIQSGQRHYSTLLSRENLPSPRYWRFLITLWR
nr:cysteine protease StiP domain-containing protein [Chromatium okenii]